MKYVAATLCLTICLLSIGCIERPTSRKAKPFEVVELESCLCLLIDMSGSFGTSWEDRAHKLFLQLLDAIFADAGAESRVVIGQLSGNDQVVLFEGQPNELRRKFKSPEDLNSFLLKHADPSASKVYESTRKMVDYAAALNGVTDETRMVTVVLSDMADNTQDEKAREKAKDQVLKSLEEYHERGGGLALYFVSPDQAKNWNQMLTEAGFGAGEFVIETSLSESPRLPRLN